jgi:hypothetical protein
LRDSRPAAKLPLRATAFGAAWAGAMGALRRSNGIWKFIILEDAASLRRADAATSPLAPTRIA